MNEILFTVESPDKVVVKGRAFKHRFAQSSRNGTYLVHTLDSLREYTGNRFNWFANLSGISPFNRVSIYV